MVKRLILLFLLLLLASLITPSNLVFSQELTYKKSYEDYLFALDKYREENKEFEDARNFYNQTPTLVLKEKVREKLYDMLVTRDEVLATYLAAVRMRLRETPDHPGLEKADVLGEILPEISWYRDHKAVYNKETDTLESLLSKSVETDNHFQKVSPGVFYEVLGRIAFSRYLDMKILHERIYSQLSSMVEKLDESKKPLFNRWIEDIDARFVEVTVKENEARKELDKFKAGEVSNPKGNYTVVITKLSSGRQSLVAINGYLSEMYTAIKNNGG